MTPSEPAKRGRLAAVVVAIAAVIVVIDQLTKSWAVSALADRDIDLFWTLRFRLVRNTGAAFSVAGGRGGIIALVAIAVVIALIVFGRVVETRVGAVSLGLVLGGAVGNLVDRIFREGHGFLGGAVVDFIDVQWWPVFNVADASLVVGGILLVLVATKSP